MKQSEMPATLDQKRVALRPGRGDRMPARQKRLLCRLGWGTLLGLGLLMIYQVILSSQQPTDFCQDYAAADRFIQGIPIYLLIFVGAQSWLLWWARKQQRVLPVIAENSQEEQTGHAHTA